MRYPGPWEMVLLALATYRLWRLAAVDTITDGVREWVLDRTPVWADDFLVCPWCLGFWIGGLVWTGWWYWPTATLAALTPFILSAAVGLVRTVEHAVAPD